MALKAFTHAQELAYLKARLRILVDKWNHHPLMSTEDEISNNTRIECADDIQDLLDTIDKMDYKINHLEGNK